MKRLLTMLILVLAFGATASATEITVPSFTIPNFAGSSAPKVRVYYSTTFTASDGTVVAQGTPSSGTIYKVVSTTLNLGTVTVPAFTIQSTTDGIDFKTARVSFYLYNGSAQISPNPLSPYTSLIVPPLISSATGCSPSGTCASLAELKIWTNGSPPLPPDTYYTKSDIDRLLAALGPGSTFTLAAGSSGSDFNISGTSPNFAVNLPAASATSSGKVTTGAQTFAGAKTFTGNLIGTTATFSGAITVASCTGCGGGGAGTVSTVSVVTANGVSGSVANPTTTPAITLTLGAITPTSVNGYTLSGAGGTLTLGTGGTVAYAADNLSLFAATTSAQLAGVLSDETGTGLAVFNDSPVFIGASLGLATATSFNKVVITPPTTSATLTLVDGSSLIRAGAHALTLTTTGASNVTFPASGTLVTNTVTSLPNLAQVGTITSGTIAGGTVLGAVTITLGANGSGDMYYRNASGVLTRIPAGSLGQILGMGGSNVPFWTTGGGGGSAGGSDTQLQYNASGFFSGVTGVVSDGTNLTVKTKLNACLDAGSTDSYACSLSPVISAYATGQIFWFKANTSNTGAATLNINGTGAIMIKKATTAGITTDLATDDIKAGQWVQVMYDGSNMQMLSATANAAAGTGTVTSIATTAPITGGTITTTGTIACPTCTTNAASLTSNLPVIGGGSNAVAVGTVQGNTTKFVTFAGSAPATNDCAKFDVNGNLVTNGSSCGGGGGTPGGSDTQVQFNNVGSFGGSAALTWSSPALSIGVGSTTAGQLKFLNATNSNVLTFHAGVTGSALTFTLPTADATGGNDCLRSNESGVLSFGACTGTGSGTVTNSGNLTANAIVIGNSVVDVKVVVGLTTDGVSKLVLGVAGASVGGIDFKNATTGTINLSPVTGALGTSNLVLPAASDTLVGKATTDTFTNKTFDTASTGNSFKIAGTAITSISGNAAKVVTTTGALTNGDCVSIDANGNFVAFGSACNSGGGGTPGGSNTQVQYNNSSAFGGITGVTSNGTIMTFSSGATGAYDIITGSGPSDPATGNIRIWASSVSNTIQFTNSTGGSALSLSVADASTSATKITSGTAGQVLYEQSGANPNRMGEVTGFTSDGTSVTAGSGNLIATRPKFITSIDDTNGNELFKVTATASAVNEFTVANAATGGNPLLSATGGDTNIGIRIDTKGTGKIGLNVTPAAGIALDVQGTATNGTIALRYAVNTSPLSYSIYNATTTRLASFAYAGAGGQWLTNTVLGDIVLMSETSNALFFGTNSVERMRILSTGEVSIGGFSPAKTFHVRGGAVPVEIDTTGSTLAPGILFAKNSNGTNLGTIGFAAGTNDFATGVAASDAVFLSNQSVGFNFITGGVIINKITGAGVVKIAGTVTRGTTEGTNHLDIFNGTAPVGTLTNGISLYSASGELNVMDAAGNNTLLSPHDGDGNWIHRETNFKGRYLRVEMERLVKLVQEMCFKFKYEGCASLVEERAAR